MMKKLIATLAVSVTCATAALATPSAQISSRPGDSYVPGRHQFYVWCADGNDHMASLRGASAADAKARLETGTNCRAVWQGRLAG